MANRARSFWNRLMGNVTPIEGAVALASAGVSAAVVGVSTARRVGWIRGLVMGVVAFDLCGGLVSFQLGSTREEYAHHSDRRRLVFVLVHLQPFVLPLVGQGTWGRAGVRYAAAVGGTLALERVGMRPEHRRPVANGSALALAVADLMAASPDQRWLGPVYLLKLVGGHGGIPRVSSHQQRL
ncbi:hypothetical protein AADG42_02515 [Ammonicoccus fulvus]|uniref:Uncharacterized protein n=1 Tax=Ammonicoccus fulvus TaxID=3138240 RepID=A0ABZ3FMY6_9ACTN